MDAEQLEGNVWRITAYALTLPTIGSIRAESELLTVRDVSGFVVSDPLLVAGAGALGGDLETTIDSIAGNVFNLAAAAGETATRVQVGRRTNPSTSTFKVSRPDGVVTTIAHPNALITNPIAGKFILTYAPPADVEGWYRGRFIGTGAAECADEVAFYVAPSRVD